MSLVTYTNKRRASEALYVLWFDMCLSVFNRQVAHEKPQVLLSKKKSN